MSEKIFQSNNTSSTAVVTTTTASSDSIHRKQCIAQNSLLIWMNASIDKSEENYENTLSKLQKIVHDVNIFTQADECVDFLTDVNDLKVFLIIEGTFGEQIVPLIHDISQLDSVYVLCHKINEHEQWAKQWVKVKGVHAEITHICESLRQAVKQCDQDAIAVSFVAEDELASNQNLDQLEPSFMYTQIFKEILLEMEPDEQSIKDFTTFWRVTDIQNNLTLNVITEFERDYCPEKSIWWYTRAPFVYLMLNRALRTLEGETIIKMGFFIGDLHDQLRRLHQQQVDNYHGQRLIVYRGQGLSTTDFEKLLKTKGGLISFNNFLSTSEDKEISLVFADSASAILDTVGILFEMSIDPSISSAPFASIGEFSYFHTEEEIIFSMHTVFRIGEITKINDNARLYQVELKLTADDDQQLTILRKRIREETSGFTGWDRLGRLLIKIGQFDKARKLYNVLLEQTFDESKKAIYYNQLGYVEDDEGEHTKALAYYEKSLEICEKHLHSNYFERATPYNNIGLVYYNMGEYSKALSFLEKAVEIMQKTLPTNHLSLAAFYNNIGLVYNKVGEYSKALSFFEKTLEITQQTLPANHPSLATSYNNIASVYDKMGEHSKALVSHENVLAIRQRVLPLNHPDFVSSYNNIGSVYNNMGEYSKAVSFYEKALEIIRQTLPANHPSLATSYSNVAFAYDKMGEFSKALSSHKNALRIRQKALPQNHPDLAHSYNNVGKMHQNIGEYSKALSSFEKALEIQQKILPANHPDFATSYNNIALVYGNMGENSRALSFCEKVRKIQQNNVPENHPDFVDLYNNIGVVYQNMEDYSKALSFFEKALNIQEKTLPANHSLFATSYNNIGLMYKKNGGKCKSTFILPKIT